MKIKLQKRWGKLGEAGVAALELALALPVMLTMAFAVIDYGRLIQARLVLTNVAREGGSLASRDIQSATDLIAMLQSGASPLNLSTSGRINIWKISAGTSQNSPYPMITLQASTGSVQAQSSMGNEKTNLGLTPALYQRLVYDGSTGTADLSQITVVEVFYRYSPIMPLAYVPGLSSAGRILGSKAVF